LDCERFFLLLAADLFYFCRDINEEDVKVQETEENTREDDEVSLVEIVQRSYVHVSSNL
jgi:hypothetical protein